MYIDCKRIGIYTILKHFIVQTLLGLQKLHKENYVHCVSPLACLHDGIGPGPRKHHVSLVPLHYGGEQTEVPTSLCHKCVVPCLLP